MSEVSKLCASHAVTIGVSNAILKLAVLLFMSDKNVSPLLF